MSLAARKDATKEMVASGQYSWRHPSASASNQQICRARRAAFATSACGSTLWRTLYPKHGCCTPSLIFQPELPPPRSSESDVPWLRPSVYLLGLPKTGTSSLFACLTSDVFAQTTPRPCCGMKHKEPGILKPTVLEEYLANRAPRGQQFSLQWPTEELSAEFGPVLDFTVTYLAGASWSLPSIMRLYPEPIRARLHFVVALRRPVARARSMFCMFAAGKETLQHVLRHDVPGGIVERARRRMQAPGMLPKLSELNASIAQGEASALLHARRLLFPWVGDSCNLRGWGWESREKNLTVLVREELEQLSHCSRRHRVGGPKEVHQMSSEALEAFVADCHRDSSHYNCARPSARARGPRRAQVTLR